jgi:hypothetical protein
MNRETAEKFAEDAQDMLKAVFPDIRGALLNVFFDEVDANSWTVGFPLCGVDVSWQVEVPSIGKTKTAPGYRVWIGVVSGGTHWPEEMEDVTYCETTSYTDAIKAVCELYMQERIDRYYDNRYETEDV